MGADEPNITRHLAAGVGLCRPPNPGEQHTPPPQGWDAHWAPGSHPTETPISKGGAAAGALPFPHPWGWPQLGIALWLGRTWAGWDRDEAGSVPSAQGCVSPSSMGTPGQGAQHPPHPIPSHPVPHSPRHQPGLLEDSHHWGWLTPGDNIMSQWGAASLIGHILPLPLLCQAPLCSPPSSPHIKSLAALPQPVHQPTGEEQGSPTPKRGERGYVHAVFFLLLQCQAEPRWAGVSCGAGKVRGWRWGWGGLLHSKRFDLWEMSRN